MKNLLLLTIIIGLNVTSTCFGQQVFELFSALPDSAVLNLNREEREKIIQISKDNNTWEDAVKDLNTKQTHFAFEKANVENGYLKMIGNFEGKWEMKVWKITSNYSLVGIYKETCGPVCHTEQLDLYRYEKSKGFKNLNLINVFPVQNIQEYIASKLLPPYELEEDNNLGYLLFQFGEDSSINISWNESMAEKYRLELNFQLYWLPDNLKNETYFGIKEN
ncbi:MAG: DUF3256 family protein [Chitinophagales bacterium]